jgi:branched-chain amino acid transport system permease protein
MLATALISGLVSGLGLGSMYGLIALGFTLTFAVSGTVNFAQGSSLMLGAVVVHMASVGASWPMPLAIAVALAACAVWGLVVERLAIRPFVRRNSNSWLMASVALGIVLDNLAMAVFGKEPRALNSALADEPWVIGGVGVFPLQLLIPVIGLGLAALVQLALARTGLGLRLRGAAQNADAARLMGIDVTGLVAITYAVAAALAGVAGVLVAPLFNVAYDMGTLFGIKAFAVAILGGLTRPWGVVAAGLLYGLVEAFTTTLLGSGSTQIVTFSAVIAALALAPEGLFTRRRAARI